MARSLRGGATDDYYRQVAARLIREMERSDSPWKKAWQPGGGRMPYNLQTGKPYRGGNSILLLTTADQRGYNDERWGTYKQVRNVGGYVRRGQKGCGIVYWQFEKRKLARDQHNQPVMDEKGRPVYQTEQLARPRVFRATVFNAEQCAGLPERPDPGEQARWSPNEEAERAIQKSGAILEHTKDDQCYYDFGRDRIVVPRKGDFPEASGYYQSVLHELGHWTGHPSRLNRQTLMRGMDQGLRSREYAKEELRAEISSMMTGDRLRIGHDPSRNAAYVKVWIKRLKEDPRELYRAARDAQQISDYLLGRARARDLSRSDRAAQQVPERAARSSATNGGRNQQPNSPW